MLPRPLLRLFLLLSLFAAVSPAQPKPEGPVTLAEVRSMLTRAEESGDLIKSTNLELIAAIEARGVDFVLTPEEEWALQMREASNELIEAIRSAVNPVEREFRLRVARQESLYLAFAQNFSRHDLTSKSAALSAGRDFIADYADDPNVAEIVNFMRRQMPSLERSVQALERQAEMMEQNRIRSLYQNAAGENNRRGRRETPAQTNTNSAAPSPNPAPAPPPNQQQQQQNQDQKPN